MFGRTVVGGLATPTGGHMTLQLAGNQTGTETVSSKMVTDTTSRASTAGQTTLAMKTAGMGEGYMLYVNCISCISFKYIPKDSECFINMFNVWHKLINLL